MKKTKFMRAALLLLVLTLITSCFVGGTFAKYTTSGNAQNHARVAKWGIELDGNQEFGKYGTLFAYEYATDDKSVTGIAKSVIGGGYTPGSKMSYVFAPGTGGKTDTLTIKGTTEVAVHVEREADIAFGLYGTEWLVNGEFYCPLVFTITKDGQDKIIKGTDHTSAESLISALESEIELDELYAPNVAIDKSLVVKWDWPFNGTDGKQTDKKDTALASYGDTWPEINIAIDTKVTQID